MAHAADAGMQNPGSLYLMDLAERVAVGSRHRDRQLRPLTNAIRYLRTSMDGRTRSPRSILGPSSGQMRRRSAIRHLMDDYTEFVLDTFRRNVAFFSRGTLPTAFGRPRMTSFGAGVTATVTTRTVCKPSSAGRWLRLHRWQPHVQFCRRDFEHDRRLDVAADPVRPAPTQIRSAHSADEGDPCPPHYGS